MNISRSVGENALTASSSAAGVGSASLCASCCMLQERMTLSCNEARAKGGHAAIHAGSARPMQSECFVSGTLHHEHTGTFDLTWKWLYFTSGSK